MGALVDAEPAHALFAERALETGDVGALGKPEAAGPAEAPSVRADPGVELEPQPRQGRQHRQHGVGRRRGGELDPARLRRLAEGAQGIAADRVEQLEGVAVATELGLAGLAALGRHLVEVGLRRLDPEADQELTQPLARAGVLELVGEDRGDGHRQPLGDLEHRQVGAHDRVEQPLLAERVGPEPLDVGHVGVEDDRQVAGGATS